MNRVKYCEVTLTEEKYQAFVYAVKNHYWYQMYIDDLPIWGRYTGCIYIRDVKDLKFNTQILAHDTRVHAST